MTIDKNKNIWRGPDSSDDFANQIRDRIFQATGEFGWFPADDQSALPYVADGGKEVIDVYNFKASVKFRTYNLTDDTFLTTKP